MNNDDTLKNSKTIIVNDIEIEKEVVKELMYTIILLEKKNLRTKEKSSPDMVKDITKLIEKKIEEAKRCD